MEDFHQDGNNITSQFSNFILYRDFLGLCSDQQLCFFTLLDRTSFPHHNNITSVFMSHREIDVLERAINSELPKLALWFRSNLLSINVLKTNFIHFKGRKSTDNKCLQVKLNSMQIERKTCTKFLGVYINET